MKVAPFYDLVCGRAYDYFELAQSIGGENQFSLITRLEWKQFANDCDISFVALQKIANILVSKVKKALPELSERIKQETKQPIIETITEVINTHCDYLVESLIS